MNLIKVHQAQQAAETKKRGWCLGEIKKKKGEKANTIDALKTLTATINRKTAEVKTSSNTVKNLRRAIAKSEKRNAVAAKLRRKAAAIYAAGKKDRLLSIKVLKQAKQVMAKFYDSKDKTKTTLLQTNLEEAEDEDETSDSETLAKPKTVKNPAKPKTSKMPKTWSGSSRKSA